MNEILKVWMELLARSLSKMREGLGHWSGRVLPVLRRWTGALFAPSGGLFRTIEARSRGIRWALLTGVVASAGLSIVAVSLLFYSGCGPNGCPDVDQLTAYQPGGAPVLVDRNGDPFADLAPYERVVVSLDSLPAYVPAALIAVEDRRFWAHGGVDWRRVVGAAWANVRSRAVRQGSSTIPMQLARSVFPTELPQAERTLRRKVGEVRVARSIEEHFGKHEILEMYLNHVYFGGGAYGIEAASRLYFGRPASELTLGEAATLAALLRAPSHYDPRRNPERSRERRDLVIGLMAEQGLIDAESARLARESELSVREDQERDRSGIPLGANFVEMVRTVLEEHFGEELYRSRLRIHTTLDANAQRLAESELSRQLDDLAGWIPEGEGGLEGSVVILEAHSGDVLALVGGRDPTVSRYNRAVLARRQLGSAFKPFVFAAALEKGVPTSRVLMDVPLQMQVSRNNVWQPANYDGQFEGSISLRSTLVRSRNVPTVRLATEVGIGDVARVARSAGLNGAMDETPALALGTVAVSPLQLATAYTTFATLGHTSQPRFVLRVEDDTGQVLWEAPPSFVVRGMDPRVAYIVTDMLKDAVNVGTGAGVRAAGFRGPVAGKTGTTNDATDVWFAGYTPDLVGVVWIGYDRPSPLGSGATGGGFAAPVWGNIMRQLYGERPMPSDWRSPEGIVRSRVDLETGLVIRDGCDASRGSETSELFLAEFLPASTCPSRGLLSTLRGLFGGGRDNRNPPPSQPVPAVPVPRGGWGSGGN